VLEQLQNKKTKYYLKGINKKEKLKNINYRKKGEN